MLTYNTQHNSFSSGFINFDYVIKMCDLLNDLELCCIARRLKKESEDTNSFTVYQSEFSRLKNIENFYIYLTSKGIIK